MTTTFLPWHVDEVWLLPPSIQDLVPAGHVAHFVRDAVRDGVDLSPLLEAYEGDRGSPAFHPGMMTALLLYAYSQGIYSSRGIAGACEERLDFAAVTGLQRPDFRAIAEFRKRHLSTLSRLFTQVLRLCRSAGLARLGHVTLDGKTAKAGASKPRTMSRGRMAAAEAALSAEARSWLAQAAQADRRENRTHGADRRRGDEQPDWLADRARRRAKIREARAALETETRTVPAALTDNDAGETAQRARPARRPTRTAGRSTTRHNAISPSPKAGS